MRFVRRMLVGAIPIVVVWNSVWMERVFGAVSRRKTVNAMLMAIVKTTSVQGIRFAI
jgi:hypothetical protein